MRLLVCERSSLRRKPIEAVFSARDIFGVGVPRARVRWVVFEERSQRRPGRGVARAPWRARDTGRLPKANEPACLQSIAGDRCSGPERRNTRAQPRRGAAGEAMGKRGLIDRLYSEIEKSIRGGPEARPQRRPAKRRPERCRAREQEERPAGLAAEEANGRDVCTVGAHSGRIARRLWGPRLK